MLYTVNEVAQLTGVTVKTLYHYHKIGLLKPCKISEAGYRLYSMQELERLQQILFYRELDFSLKDIHKALKDEPSRQWCLTNQYELLIARRQRLNLKNRWAVTDKRLHNVIDAHLAFLNNHGIKIDAKSFVKQTKFFLTDDFHRNMLESQQTGLSNYLSIAAEAFTSAK